MNSDVILQRGLRVAERAALLLGMAVTAAAVCISVFFLVRDAVDAAQGVARISVPALAQLDISTLGPRVQAGAYGDVDLSIVDAPESARVLLVVAAVIAVAAVVTAGVAVFLLCLSLLRGRPFGRSVTGVWFLVAIVMIGTGIAGPLLRGEASRLIVSSLTVGNPESPIALGDAVFYIAREIDVLPLVIGFVLLVVAGAFAVGSRLRRETQGLI